MSFHQLVFFLARFSAVCILLAAGGSVAGGAGAEATRKSALDDYKTSTTGGAVFLYPADEQAFVDEIAGSYTFPIRLLNQSSFDEQMAVWQRRDLSLMAKWLGLPKPTGGMNAVFDQFRDFCKPTVGEGIGEVRIYHLADLREAAARGAKVEGITYVPEGNAASVALYMSVERAAAGGAREKFRVAPIVLPDLPPGDLATRMRIFNGTLRDMRWRLDEAIYNAYCGRLYEIAKPEITAIVNQSRFPLWLIDGMTNAIPLAVMRADNPGLSFDQILSSRGAQPPDFKKLAAGIDPDTWVMTRARPPPTKAESDSYFYLALLVTLDAIQENGEDWLPVFFNRLRKENSPLLSMAVVHKIYAGATGGKDLNDSIARVKEKLAEAK